MDDHTILLRAQDQIEDELPGSKFEGSLGRRGAMRGTWGSIKKPLLHLD
jgi:hypothetical protein